MTPTTEELERLVIDLSVKLHRASREIEIMERRLQAKNNDPKED